MNHYPQIKELVTGKFDEHAQKALEDSIEQTLQDHLDKRQKS